MSDDPVRVDVTRRQLLKRAAAVAAATAGVSAVANCGGGATGLIDAGPVSAFMTPGTFLAVDNGNYIVGHDSGGLLAYSGICTHQSCPVPAPASASANSTCTCHFSQFNANGDWVTSPAMPVLQRNLAHYAVTINSGRVMIDPTMVVTDRTVRTPLG